MATRWCVSGGSGSWGGTNNWSSVGSGGASGASAPGASDDAIFDANSNATMTTVSNTSVGSIDFTNYTGTFNDDGNIWTIGKSTGNSFVIFGASMTLTSTGTWQSNTGFTTTVSDLSAGTTNKINSLRPSTGTITLATNISLGNFTSAFSGGTLNSGGYTITTANIGSSQSNGTINLGASTVNFGGSWTYTGGTFNAGTSTINFTNASTTFAGGGATYYNLAFSANAAYTLSVTGSNTFNNLSATTTAAFTANTKFTAGTTQTINGTFTVIGNASTHPMTIESSTAGTRINLVCNGGSSITDGTFIDTAVTGTSMPLNAYTGSGNTNNGDNSGIQFNANYDVIQQTTPGTGLASTATSPAIATTTGHMLAAVITENQTGNTWTVSDATTGNNTWTQAGSTITNTNQSIGIYYAKNITGNAAETVTVTSTGVTSDVAIVVYEVIGMDLTSPYDKTAYGSTTGTTPICSTATGVLSQANEVVIAALITADTTPSHITHGTTSYYVTPYPAEVSTAYCIAVEYTTVSATTTLIPKFSDSTSAAYAIVAATFKYTAVASGGKFLTLLGVGP